MSLEVPDIQSLSLRVKELGSAVDIWNLVMLWALGFAALAAIVVLITTRIITTRSGQLNVAQALLSDEKERLLKADLAQKDLAIAGLTLRAQTAEGQIAEATRGAAEATRGAAEANKATEIEKIERLRLEESVRPRRLSPEQKTNLADMLKKHSAATVPVATYVGTPDGTAFGADLIEALRAAGWNSPGPVMIVTGGGELRDLSIWVRDAQHPPSAAQSLKEALHSVGIETSLLTSPQPSPDGLSLFIAPRK